MSNERLSKQRAPLYEMLLEYRKKGQVSFHVPGHKNGKAYRQEESGFLEQVMEVDVTEITGTDDLHHPEGVIQEAQSLAADCFGAEESFFLVGGSTVGNLALILTVCTRPGDIMLVQRNVHKSVLHGLMLAGAKVVFLQPQIDPESRLATAPSAATVREGLKAYPNAKGVLVTMPNYYGMGSSLEPIAEVCHHASAAGVPLLVDEAHGAHYGQHPQLPQSALNSGADGVVQSTHKMLSALTMGAMLHVQGPRINRGLLRQRLAMVQSSSPSYPVMGSLDLARRHLHVHGAGAFTAGLAAVNALRRGLAELPRFGLLHPQEQQPGSPAGEAAAGSIPPRSAQGGAYTTQDPFKVVIYDKTGVLSGYELQQRLEAYGCVPEMSDDQYVVLLFSLGSTEEDTRHLLEALLHISIERAAAHSNMTVPGEQRDASERLGHHKSTHNLEYSKGDSGSMIRFRSDHNPEAAEPIAEEMLQQFTDSGPDSTTPYAAMLPKQNPVEFSTWNIFTGEPISAPIAFHLEPIAPEDVEAIPLHACVSRVCAEMIIPYPPGIPLLYAGEVITSQIAAKLAVLADAGAKCQGAADPKLQTIVVYKKKRT